nr:double-strand break repair helicase AddA [Sphingobium nicotianae]
MTQDQEHASRPDTHVWLSASAGTGKTAVLSSRVLRLLLNGVPPERILCLTFTKAGAAEMAERVHSRLAHWVQINPADLRKELFALGEDNSDAAIGRARLLFAQVLDATGGGLRIQTIHSFCQSLLAAFPLEAGLVPGFEPLDERGQSELSRRALIAMIETAERESDEAVIAAIEMLALRLGEAGTQDYLAKCVPAGSLLEIIEDIPAFLLSFLKLPEGDVEDAIADWCADEIFPIGSLRAVAAANRAWGAASGIDCAARIAGWLERSGAGRAGALDDLLGVLMTKDGEVKNRSRDKLLAAEPDYVALASECGEAIKALLDLRRQVAFANVAAQALVAGRAYASAYAKAKRQAGAVDFDDLIRRASELLTRPGMADWIRYKLDQQVDHILVDEAQDTNKSQWDIVWSIVAEFLQVEDDGWNKLRTLFVVGDTKQAIFGFQGTSPTAFLDALRDFRGAVDEAGHPFAELPLSLSFRSMPAVLEVVDAVLDEVGHAQFGLAERSARHESARRHPGSVTILPPTSLIAAESDEEGEGGEAPEESPTEGEEDWLADHQRRHAEKIAQLVKELIGKPLATKGRDATPGDVLILLRSRGALSRLIVARLYEAGVPVAGVDRLRLQAPLAVRDLLAALRFAVQPEDDLNLANLLVSPLIGWSQDDLMNRAIPRKGSLWGHLRETLPVPDQAPLRALLASADFTTPYRYLEAILSGPMDGRRKLIARLGAEARDAIDELVNAALAFEADDHPSLQRFIDWFDRGDADIKRELGEGGDMVRVMTVHGAKGLEAPIVILADAAADPAMKPRAQAIDLPVSGASLPLMRPGKGEAGAQIEAAMEAAKTAEMEEHWRLLYVALTRAEEQLIVTGALGSRAKGVPPELSWYQAVDRAMRRMGAEPVAVPSWGDAEGRRWLGPQGLASVKQTAVQAIESGPSAEELPAWLRAPAPAEARPPRPLAPSASVEDDVPNPPPDAAMRAAAERGRLLHILFERLPDLAPAARAEAAEHWLAGPGGVGDPALRRDLIGHVSAVLDDPANAALFGPDALAEAPIAAVVEGQVIAGTVDRLLVTEAAIHVVDFKTGRAIPTDADGLPLSHVRQMAAYAAALGEIFPGHPIRASLLYTAGPRLIDVPTTLLALHKPRLGQGEQFLSPGGLETGALVP